MNRVRWFGGACCIALVLSLIPLAATAAPLAQESPGGQLGDLILLFPGLDKLAAPDWLNEGLRVTYASASATTPGDNEDLGGGGGGLIQYDVVAKERRTVATYGTFYLDLGGGSYQNNFNFPSVTSSGVGDFWVNPTALANAEDVAGDGMIVARMPYSAAGEEFDAIRLQYEGDKSTYVWMFDVASGLLLFYRHDVEVGNNAHQLAQMTLAGVRQLKLPWKSGGPAIAIKKGNSVDYTGQFSTLIAGGPVVPLPMSAHIEVTRTRPRWTLTTQDGAMNGQPSGSSPGVTGATQLFGGVWLPKDALTVRPRRAVIDTDPLTGATVTFAHGSNGTITLTESGDSWATALIYDGATGILIAVHKEVQVGVGRNIYDLQIVQ